MITDLKLIQELSAYAVVKKLTEGSSGDDKYLLEKGGEKYLLRVGAKKEAVHSKKEFDRLKMYVGQDINTHTPVCFGETRDYFYSIVTWVEGTSIMDIIKKDTTKDYYELGLSVGRELRKLHNASKINKQIDWNKKLQMKATSFMDHYQKEYVPFFNSENAKEYIEKNLYQNCDRSLVLLHGDFHWNNVVVEAGKVGIIDFSGDTVGDPWYEFGGLLWVLEYSDSFSNGQIDGYFDGPPPLVFWKWFKLYVALYAFEHLTYGNGSADDKQWRIENASRMFGIFGEDFGQELPCFRK